MVTYEFTNGTVADADEVNQNFTDVEEGYQGLVHRKQFSDATERSTSSSSWTDLGYEFTLTAPVNSLIIGFYLNFEMKGTNPSYDNEMNLKISGTNLGDYFLINKFANELDRTNQPSLDTVEGRLCFTNDTTYQDFAATGFTPLNVLDATTTINVRGKANPSSGTVLRNVTLDVVYINSFTED
jgi:hypothetical protein